MPSTPSAHRNRGPSRPPAPPWPERWAAPADSLELEGSAVPQPVPVVPVQVPVVPVVLLGPVAAPSLALQGVASHGPARAQARGPGPVVSGGSDAAPQGRPAAHQRLLAAVPAAAVRVGSSTQPIRGRQ